MFDGIDWGRADVWIAIAVLVVATAATRAPSWLVGHHITIPRRINEMLPLCAGLRAGGHHRARHADGGAASVLRIV